MTHDHDKDYSTISDDAILEELVNAVEFIHDQFDNSNQVQQHCSLALVYYASGEEWCDMIKNQPEGMNCVYPWEPDSCYSNRMIIDLHQDWMDVWFVRHEIGEERFNLIADRLFRSLYGNDAGGHFNELASSKRAQQQEDYTCKSCSEEEDNEPIAGISRIAPKAAHLGQM
jgi:hypothetical protein